MGRLRGRDVGFGTNLETLRDVPNEGACFELCLQYDKLTPAAPHGCLSSTYLPNRKTCFLKAVGEQGHRAQPASCKICKGSVLLYCKGARPAVMCTHAVTAMTPRYQPAVMERLMSAVKHCSHMLSKCSAAIPDGNVPAGVGSKRACDLDQADSAAR